MIIADTNLVIAAVGNSDIATDARAVFQLAGITVAPSLWRYEYAQWVGVKRRKRKIDAIAAEQLSLLGERLINREVSGLAIREVVDTSYRHTVSSYDAVFVRWAERLRCRVVTNDLKLVRASPVVISIEEFLDAPT